MKIVKDNIGVGDVYKMWLFRSGSKIIYYRFNLNWTGISYYLWTGGIIYEHDVTYNCNVVPENLRKLCLNILSDPFLEIDLRRKYHKLLSGNDVEWFI
jgi:hypothetical protein